MHAMTRRGTRRGHFLAQCVHQGFLDEPLIHHHREGDLLSAEELLARLRQVLSPPRVNDECVVPLSRLLRAQNVLETAPSNRLEGGLEASRHRVEA